MPNWFYSKLEISGEPKQLNKLLKQIERTPSEANKHYEASKFAFNNVIPMPDSYLQGDKWYDWRIENWGTKWETSVEHDTTSEWETGYVELEFNTAWSPCLPIIETLVVQYPKLTFRYTGWEESYSYWIDYTYKNGKMISQDEGEFHDCFEFHRFGLEHHWCDMCGEFIGCEGSKETTPILCEECNDETKREDEELWEENEVANA